MRALLAPLHRLLETSGVYAVGQWVGRPTTQRFRELIRRHVPIESGDKVLDLGCGIGGYRDCISGDYHGIDVNPRYIEAAQARHGGHFQVMDCTSLRFHEATFRHVISVATTHHLSPEELMQTVRQALRVCGPDGMVHIIDAILPITPNFTFKRLYFRADRGKYPRELHDLVATVGRAGRVAQVQTLPGPLHDTCYLRVLRCAAAAAA